MDRGKSILGKKALKGKGAMPPGDLFALGSKPSRSGDSGSQKAGGGTSGMEKKTPSFGEKLTSFGEKLASFGERKRESSSLLAPGASKKPKILASGQMFTPLGRPTDREADRRASPIPPISQAYEELAIEVDHTSFLSEVICADDNNDFERVEGLLCGAVKHLHQHRFKPDQVLYLALMHLAKNKPNIFNSETTIEAFCTLLRRDMSLNFKSKGNSLVSVLTCNVLVQAYVDESNWPDDFVKVFVDDSLGERVWVDRADCRGFVDNISTAFQTNMPKCGISTLDMKSDSAPGSASPVIGISEDDDSKMEIEVEKSGTEKEQHNIPISPRYPYQLDNIESFVMDIVREQLLKRQLMDASAKSLIKLMTATCGYAEVRQLAAQKLELWLQNPKLARVSQELLMSVCMNCDKHENGDLEVIAMLIKMRMKTKPLINHYVACIRELLGQHEKNLQVVLTQTIYNELSTSRNPNNMSLIGVMFQTKPETAAQILAEIFQELLTNKDDYLRALRALTREIVRTLRHDFNFSAFCLALMQPRTESKFTDMEQAFKERYVLGVADLVSMCILQAVTPSVREVVSALARGDRKDMEVLYSYQTLVATIQRDGIWWMHTIVPNFLELKQQEYIFCVRKVLFMEGADQYSKDNWPAEADRAVLLRLAIECPVLEDTLMRLFVIGLSRDLPLPPPDAVEYADVLIRRAANLNADGLSAWENYPTLKCLIEMVMTNNYKFPPPTTAVDDAAIEEVRARERQLSEQEKQEILEFEGHLAASTTKSMPWLAELVESSEGSLDVLPVQCLCEFLLHETIEPTHTRHDDESIKFEKHKKKQKLRKQQQLLSRLQTLVHDPKGDVGTTNEVLDYFLKRLASTQSANRALATKGLSLIVSRSELSPSEEGGRELTDAPPTSHKWLLHYMEKIPMFSTVKRKVCDAIRKAIQVESDSSLVGAYIVFLSRHCTDLTIQEMDELALDVAQLIVERTSIMIYMLPQSEGSVVEGESRDTLDAFLSLFVTYIRKAREPNTAGYTWSNTQDQIILQWETGESATMHILVVHAMIILLSYGPAHALQDLEPSQLLVFVQSFGIPVFSMTRLLQCLDAAVTADPTSLKPYVMDPSYMTQLMEVQHRRGARGGQTFYTMLTGGKMLENPPDTEEMDVSPGQDSVWSAQAPSEAATEAIPPSHVVNMLLQSVLKGSGGVANVAKGLYEILSGGSGPDFVRAIQSSPKACLLLRLILARKNAAGLDCVSTIMEKLSQCCRGDATPLAMLVRGFNKASKVKAHTAVTSKNGKGPLARSPEKFMTAALFVDWLELVEPEVVRSAPDLETRLLFCRQGVETGEGVGARHHSNQPYLLALLTHQCSWATLHRCVTSLLHQPEKRFDPVSVLDFLWACIHVPKLWQGRERRTPKNVDIEDVLGLTGPQLVVLVHYIIEEANNLLGAINHKLSSTNQNLDKLEANEMPATLRNRMPLLKACVCDQEEKVKAVVDFLEKKIKDNSDCAGLYGGLLRELYLQYPYLLAWISDTSNLTAQPTISNAHTQMDLISHRLLTGLYQPGGSTSKIEDVNIACRKLASHHPTLMLRQLPAIVGLLKGKTGFTFTEFRQRNLLLLYEHVLGILELLVPAVFEHKLLNTVLDEYFSFLQAYGQLTLRKLVGLISRLVQFLNQYVGHRPVQATALLQMHSLLAGLSLPRKERAGPTPGSSNVLPSRPASPLTMSHMGPFLHRIRKDNSEEVLNVLQDIDETSKRKLEILEHFVEDLKRLMLAPDDACRNTAFELTKRLLQNNPKKAEDFVPTFLHCLENDRPDIVMSALTNLPEFTLLCQEYATVILQRALTAGICSSIETSSYISESLQLLNLDLASGLEIDEVIKNEAEHRKNICLQENI
ncbi:INT1-like protein [Mya arenaria]|uniref:INT1-like protein n=1 Tax=Mya arenaria TaxID=6604 RepID=A0ABY7DL63_MYAAR|nr:INT1-like protein [Mya arenaria]